MVIVGLITPPPRPKEDKGSIQTQEEIRKESMKAEITPMTEGRQREMSKRNKMYELLSNVLYRGAGAG